MIVPDFLRPGEPVIVTAPSGPVDKRRLEAGLAYLSEHRHPSLLTPHVLERHGYFAGRDELRAGDLNEVIGRDDGKAIFLARGGYGFSRILNLLDLEALRRRPRLLLGYSDATALFMALQAKGPYLVHYGPVVSDMGTASAFDERSLWSALYGQPSAFTVPFRASDVVRSGRGAGRLVGGCLSLLVTLLGTPHDFDYRGCILFWEDTGEEPYRIDRMLTQLRNAGKFDRLRGMVVGSLIGCEAPEGKPSLEIREIILDLAQLATFPIVWNLRAGHVPGKITLMMGLEASLRTSRRSMLLRLPRGRARALAG